MDDETGVVCTHGLEYALSRPLSTERDKQEMDCNACKFVPFFFDELRTAVRSSAVTYDDLGEGHAIDAIDRCENLTCLWRGQCARVANQRRAIAGLHARLQRECLENKWTRPRHVIAVLDYKMKYVSQYFRQMSIQHFGKRGISWHGFLVIFYTYNPDTGKAEREHVYCDQILRGTNKQDGLAVAALLELFLSQLLEDPEFGDVESATIQSDNANYYHSNNLILSLAFIGLSVGIRIERYIHSETCDGKNLIDAHFAMGMRFVDRYIGEGNDAASPGDVFRGLADAGGIPNSAVQLVEINRAMLLRREESNAPVLSALTKITRQNEIVFELIPSRPDAQFSHGDPFSWSGVVRMKTWQFSGIGEPVVFDVDVRKGTVDLVSGALQDLGALSNGDEEDHNDAAEDQSASETAVVDSTANVAFGGSRVKFKDFGMLRHIIRRVYEARRRTASNRRRQNRTTGGGTWTAVRDPSVTNLDCAASRLIDEEASGELSIGGDRDDVEHDVEDSSDEDEEVEDVVQVEKAQRKDLLAFAVRHTKELVNDPMSALHVRDGSSDQAEYELTLTYDVRNKLTRRGFGRRPRHGSKMGRSQAGPFRAAIAEAFKNEGTDKLHPSWILEQLKEMKCNKYRLDFPSEADVRKELQRCIRWKRSASKAGGPSPDYVELMSNVVDPVHYEYSEFMDREIEKNPELKPAAFIKAAVAFFLTRNVP